MNVDQYTEVPGWWNREELKAQLIQAVENDKKSENQVIIVMDSFSAFEETKNDQ